jgi:prepilin-type N-terminal cleavage/methylation domain-containing protein
MKRKGYTIFELLIVMVLVGIISVTAMLGINTVLRGLRLSGATDKLAADLRYAQTMAVGTGRWYGVNFEIDPVNRYTLYTTTGTQDATIDNPARFGTSYIVNTNTDYGVTISSAAIGGGTKVEFSPLGTPYTDRSGAAISTEGVVTMAQGSSTRTVRITANTGRITVQ